MFGWTEEKRNDAFSVDWLEQKRGENGWKEERAHQFFRFFFLSNLGGNGEKHGFQDVHHFFYFLMVSQIIIFLAMNLHPLFVSLGHKSKIPKQRKILTFLMHMRPTTICLFGDEI
jgi:hypothetical protein